MTARLIYHTPDSMTGAASPFDTAIMDMTEGQDLQIACPYLGLSYVQRIIERSNAWRLLTDVQEWLTSQDHESRGRIVDFILANRQRVRHCKDLHAKVLIAGTQALTGSANFTEKGITRRVEVSVLFDGCEQVEELRVWFDMLWDCTTPVAEADLRSCATTIPPPVPSVSTILLPCAFPGITSQLRRLQSVCGSPDAEKRLVIRLRLAPDRQWAESWLDLAKELIEVAGLVEDDDRLVMSIPQGNFLPVTINRRYVLTAFRIDEGQHEKSWLMPDYTNPPGHAVVELILPSSLKDRIDYLPGAIRHSSFDPGFSGETADNVPRFVSFSMASKFNFDPKVLEGWQEAILDECKHQRLSNFRKYHEPAVYRAATDLEYRKRLLDRTFPTTDS